LVKAVLDARGYRVAEAEDLDQGWTALIEAQPSLVLLDVRLRGASGLDLVQRMRADPRFQRLPVIAVTAHAMRDDEPRILSSGCDAYLSKPIDTRALPEMVARFLRRSGRKNGV
jgi:two-component system, cell cycle response regulator DivK